MTVSTIPQLLIDCLHDLSDGHRQLSRRLGDTIAGATDDPSFGQVLQLLGRDAGEAAEELKSASDQLSLKEPDASNLWMKGILDDAERDIEMIDRGRLLDIALVGAIQKALASCDVSFDTALAVAAECDHRKIGKTLENAQRLIRRDRKRLSSFLYQFCESQPAS